MFLHRRIVSGKCPFIYKQGILKNLHEQREKSINAIYIFFNHLIVLGDAY